MSSITSPELLAPAGTPEAAWAALAYGADAIYAGLPRFSARAKAANFTFEALDELIGYAHSLDRRVYITFNTLVQQHELDAALDTLAQIRDLHADGVIVQDMGVAHLIRTNFPQLRLHASTQLAVHNLAGARQLAANGFARVVLARELSLKEIAHISRECGIETEAFIHGALCYSYSGLCLFSSHLLGRSGNRGHCAYCCRQPFHSENGTESLPFSMKDFTAADHLHELLETGVSSLKIEGRMKGPLYVAAVTDFYKKSIAGEMKNPEQTLSDIQTIFGRPSTDLYLSDSTTEPIDPVNDGHRGAQIGTVKSITGSWLILHTNRALQKHDGLKVESDGTHAYGFAADQMRLADDPPQKRRFELPAGAEIALQLPADAPRLQAGAPIYCSFSQAVRQRYSFSAPRPGQYRQRRPVDIHIFQTLEKMEITASADGIETTHTLPGPFEPAKQPEKSADAIRRCFSKLGDTDWQLGELTFEGDPIFAPASILNEARRQLIADFSNIWKKAEPSPTFLVQGLETFPKATSQESIRWSVKMRDFQPLENIDEFVLEIDPAKPEEIEKAHTAYSDKLRLALPVIIRDAEVEAFKNLIDQFPTIGKWEAANVGGLQLLKGKPDITADWPLYTLNTQAALEWKAQGICQFVLSPEDQKENFFALIDELGDGAIVPVYQHTPLMISATQPAADGNELIDRSNRAFRVETNGREFVVVNEVPFSLANHMDELQAAGARHFRIDLSYSPTEKAQEIIDDLAPGHSGNFNAHLH
ncbi:MAG: U32 family peptidase [Kiritimatiellales bacterium]|nr:U32 family peptidase [Kiritimatiellales bacterium]